MIRLIASDVDGTLIPEGTPAIHPDFFQVIRDLKERGITFVAASGRSYGSVRSVFEEVADDIYFISNNGGILCYQGQVRKMYPLEEEMILAIITYFREMKEKHEVFYLLTTEEQDYTECDDKEMMDWIRNGYKVKVDWMKDACEVKQPLVKMSIYFKNIDAMVMAEEAKARFGDRISIMASGEHWIDFVNKDAQKGNALREIQSELGITEEETMAFGDNDNDISLLLAAKESYAVSGAREAVKEIVRYVLPDTTTETVLNVVKGL